jgi:hypothetical protein
MQIIIIALALGVIYFLFSSLVSVLSEMRGNIIRSRQKTLKNSIYEAFNDEDKNTAFGNFIYYHPQLDLYRKTADDMVEHIPPENLAKALLAVLQRYTSLVVHPKQSAAAGIPPVYGENNLIPLSTVADYHSIINMLQPSDKRVLFSSFAMNAQDLPEVEKNISKWFDGYMVEAANWYKKQKKAPLFVLSLLAAIFLNVDSIRVVKYLGTHSTETLAIAAKSSDILSEGRPAAPGTNENKPIPATHPAPDSPHAATHADSTALNPKPVTAVNVVTNNDSLVRRARGLDSELRSMQLPIGWENKKPEGYDKANFFGKILLWAGDNPAEKNFFWLLLGWLITAYLGSIGAPFWFDFINRFVNIRQSGNVTQKGGNK